MLLLVQERPNGELLDRESVVLGLSREQKSCEDILFCMLESWATPVFLTSGLLGTPFSRETLSCFFLFLLSC